MFFLVSASNLSDACLTTLGVLFFLRELLKVVSIVIPVGLILMITIDFFKGSISFEEHPKVIQYVVRRIIYAIIILLIPSSIFTFFNLLGVSSSDSYTCWSFAGEASVSEVKQIMKNKEKTSEEELKQMREELAKKFRIKTNSVAKLRTLVSVQSNGGNNVGGTVVVGQKYNLSSDELKALAYVAYKEQGSPEGAAAEATLMANRYELHGSKFGSIVKYVRNSGWFASSKSRIDNPKGVPPKVLTAVKDVLVNGNRTMPLYIDEHDCFSDIKRIVTSARSYSGSAVKDRSHYIPNDTVIYNRMGAKYTFYKFPTSFSDPFGYTSAAKNKIDNMNK